MKGLNFTVAVYNIKSVLFSFRKQANDTSKWDTANTIGNLPFVVFSEDRLSSGHKSSIILRFTGEAINFRYNNDFDGGIVKEAILCSARRIIIHHAACIFIASAFTDDKETARYAPVARQQKLKAAWKVSAQ